MPNTYEEFRALTEAQLVLPSPTPESEFYSFIGRKSGWQPAKYTQSTFKVSPVNTHVAVQKALALALALEIPVGEFTLEASKREFTGEQRWALLDNSKDELVHYEALSNWASGLSTSLPQEYLDEAQAMCEEFLSNVEHPVLKAGFIELGIFFPVLSIFRKFGTTSLKLLASDISRDEASHVLTNWAVIKEQEIAWDLPSLNKVRREVISWLTEDIKSSKFGADFWLAQSDSLITTRQAEGLKFTKVAQYTALFEVDNRSLAQY